MQIEIPFIAKILFSTKLYFDQTLKQTGYIVILCNKWLMESAQSSGMHIYHETYNISFIKTEGNGGKLRKNLSCLHIFPKVGYSILRP